MPDVVNAVLQHRDPLRSYAESEAGVLLGIVAGAGQDPGMHHARAHNFNPAAVPADAAAATLAPAREAVNGHIHARLDEGKVVAAEPDAPVFAEQAAGKLE